MNNRDNEQDIHDKLNSIAPFLHETFRCLGRGSYSFELNISIDCKKRITSIGCMKPLKNIEIDLPIGCHTEYCIIDGEW